MSTQQINLLAQVNTLMVRSGIAIHRAERAASTEADRLMTFARAARDRAQFLMAQLG